MRIAKAFRRRTSTRAAAYLGLAEAALREGKPVQARAYAHRALLLEALARISDRSSIRCSSWRQTFNGPAESEQALEILHTAAALVEQVPIDGLDAEKRATRARVPARRVRRE